MVLVAAAVVAVVVAIVVAIVVAVIVAVVVAVVAAVWLGWEVEVGTLLVFPFLWEYILW